MSSSSVRVRPFFSGPPTMRFSALRSCEASEVVSFRMPSGTGCSSAGTSLDSPTGAVAAPVSARPK
jgi:hypothetical protein